CARDAWYDYGSTYVLMAYW
nr:immunoglobulin heavy chain junction region [Macaca mulatta]MOV52648.1 immunoglobulin heavy chain junction region [Macaca mulatta]